MEPAPTKKFLTVLITISLHAHIIASCAHCSGLEQSPPKYILTGQPLKALKTAVARYSRIRDYYFLNASGQSGHISRAPFSNFPTLIIFNVIAASVNATLVETQEIFGSKTYPCINEQSHPKILIVFTNSVVIPGYKLPFQYWQEFYTLSNNKAIPIKRFSLQKRSLETQLPIYTWIGEIDVNFLYCDIPKKLKISPWNSFTLFTEPFDYSIWITLPICFIIVAMLLSEDKSCQDRGTMIFVLFSTTLQLGTKEFSRNSGILMVWMGMAMILAFYYTGELTSTVIRPHPDDVMTKLKDLLDRNYTLYFPSYENYIFTAVTGAAMSIKNTSTVKKDLQFLMENYVEIDPSDDEFKNFFVAENKFRFHSLDDVIYLQQAGNHLIQQNAQTTEAKARKCHVGKELFRVDEKYIVTLPPGNKALTKVLDKLVHSGIFQRWYQERRDMTRSRRVQDRVRFARSTNIKEDEDNLPVALQLQGKTVTIFLLWVICIFVSMVAIWVELAIIKFHKMNVQVIPKPVSGADEITYLF